MRPIKAIRAVDAHTLVMTTEKPHPLLPNDLSTVYIVSKKAAASASTDDFNNGKAAHWHRAVQAGPFAKGDRPRTGPQRCLVGRQNTRGEGDPAHSDHDPARRVAALLSGDIRALETRRRRMARLKNGKNLSLPASARTG